MYDGVGICGYHFRNARARPIEESRSSAPPHRLILALPTRPNRKCNRECVFGHFAVNGPGFNAVQSPYLFAKFASILKFVDEYFAGGAGAAWCWSPNGAE